MKIVASNHADSFRRSNTASDETAALDVIGHDLRHRYETETGAIPDRLLALARRIDLRLSTAKRAA